MLTKFRQCEGGTVKTQRNSASRYQNPVDLLQRLRDIHIRQSYRRNYAVKASLLEWHFFSSAMDICPMRESQTRHSQPILIDVESHHIVIELHAPRSQISARATT
jgi:hypothetical protein